MPDRFNTTVRRDAYGLSDHYRQISLITRLADFVTLHPDRSSAVA